MEEWYLFENEKNVDVEKLAGLARIALGDDEAREITRDLAERLNFIDRIADIDLEGVPPAERILPYAAALRDDVVGACLPRDVMLSNASEKTEGFVQVPTVVGEEAGA